MPSYAITGAARGLGHEFVKQLSANPANTVFGIVRNPDTATGLASLAGSNPNVHVVRGDVVSSEQLAAAAAVIANVTGGSLDVLIHNAASTDTATAMLDPSQLPSDVAALHEAFRPTLDTSIFGAILLTNNFLSLIRAGTEKKIIHISSGMADTELIRTSGISYAVPYAAAKAALNVVVAKYAVDLRSEDIKVLAMSPGWVDTYEGPAPKPAAIIEAKERMLGEFQKMYPALKKQASKEDSVRDQIEVINRLDASMSGLFVSHHGDSQWF